MSEHQNYTSTGCPAPEVLPHDPVPFFSNGEIHFKAHDVGWLLCGIFTVVASVTSIWLMLKHLAFFYHPHEQLHIVRLLFMPIIYAVCSFLSYYFYRQALYFQLLRDCYEALIVAAFFFLLLSYLSDPVPTRAEPHPQPYPTKAERNAQLRKVFKDLHLKKWMWPLGWIKWRPAQGGPGEGEAFLWWMRVCIGQYVLVRPLSTLAAVIGEASGYYCLASWSLKFVHIWSSAAICISVTVAMYAVLQLYMPLKKELAPYAPVLKFLCIKSVVFFTFWQETALSFLVTVGVIKSRQYWSAEEIVIGLSALLSCLEMMIFAALHVKAFSYLPYRALAAPISLDGSPPRFFADEEDELDNEKLDPSTPLTFAQWDAREKRLQAREKALSRLAKPKLPKHAGESDLPYARPDGSPFLQQTRKWPAFVKCINLLDVVREIGEEARFVFRGGKMENHDEALLEHKRQDALEAALGGKREGRQRAARLEEGYEDETAFERDLRRLREGQGGSPKAAIGADGSLILPPSRTAGPRDGAFDPVRGIGRPLTTPTSSPPSRWAGIDESYPAAEAEPAKQGWWDSFKSRGSRQSAKPATFEQLPRLDYDEVPVAGVPALTARHSIAIPAPHQLERGPQPTAQRPPAASPPSRYVPAASSLPAHRGSPASSRQEPSAASSADSGGHLPSTTLRPTSYIPPKPPSPGPFSHFQRSSYPSFAPAIPHPPAQLQPAPVMPAMPPTDGFTAFTPASSRWRRSRTPSPPSALPNPPPRQPMHGPLMSVSAVSLAPPPAVHLAAPTPPPLVMANPASRRSRGLPPGAALPSPR
ncbi:hypothetical protein JCM10207_006639 [Rhodosporidiobolus poonsookiae]